MNLENAQFQLQGLLKDEEKVAAVMKNVGDAVDGTAYSLDSAAKVASQLSASSIQAGDGMFTALRAVAGVAAMTNSEYDDIGRIFTTVAGQGRLMADQLNQLSARGMNAAATIADYLGVTEAEVREMTSKGKISFEMFAEAMDSAFGEHAKAANKTFSGSLSNIKAALARIGAEFVSPLVVQEGPLVNLFNKIREKINEVKASVGPFADTFTSGVSTAANALTAFLDKLDFSAPFKKFEVLSSKNAAWTSISKALGDVGIAVEDFQNVLTTTAKKHGVAIDEIIKAEGSLDKAMSSGKISDSIIVKALKEFADSASGTSFAVSSVTEKIEDLSEVVNRVILGDFGNGADRVKALTDAGYDYATVQDLVNKTLNGETVEFENLSDAQLKSIGYTEEQIDTIRKLAKEAETAGTPLNDLLSKMEKPSGSSLLIDSFSNAVKGLVKILKTVGGAWRDVFPPATANTLYSIIEKVHSFSEKLIMLAFAFSLKTLVKTLDDLTNMDTDKLYSTLPIMTAVVGMMAAMMIVTGRSKVDAKAGAGILAMGASILVMVQAIKMITKIETADLTKGLIVTALLATVVNGMAKSLSRTRNASSDTAKVGVGVLAMSGAFILMAEAIKILGKMDAGVLAKGLAISLGIGAIFTALIAVTKFAGENAAKAGVSMLAMSGAMILITGAVYMLGNIDSGALAQGLAAIGALGVIFAGLIAVTKIAGNAAKTIAVIAGSIAALAVVVGLMAMIEPNRLLNATVAISAIMGTMALVVASTKLTKSAEKAIITIGIVVAGLGGIIYALASLPSQSVLASAAALSTLMLSLSASMLIVSKAGNVSMQAIGALALLELAVAGIGAILGVMGALNVNPSIETASSLSILLLSLAGVTAILSAIGPIASGAIIAAMNVESHTAMEYASTAKDSAMDSAQAARVSEEKAAASESAAKTSETNADHSASTASSSSETAALAAAEAKKSESSALESKNASEQYERSILKILKDVQDYSEFIQVMERLLSELEIDLPIIDSNSDKVLDDKGEPISFICLGFEGVLRVIVAMRKEVTELSKRIGDFESIIN